MGDDTASRPQIIAFAGLPGTGNQWGRLAAEYGARLRIIECTCTDRELHRSRIDGRVRSIPGWHEIDWEHVERMRTEYPRLTVDRLVVDAVDPLDANAALIDEYLVNTSR